MMLTKGLIIMIVGLILAAVFLVLTIRSVMLQSRQRDMLLNIIEAEREQYIEIKSH